MISIEQAFELINENCPVALSETIELASSVGRVLALAVRSDIDSPPYTKSIMDGFAVLASDVSAGAKLEVLETIPAGSLPNFSVSPGKAARIMTGAPLPQGADAVVMVEQTEFDERVGIVTLNLESIESGHHIMLKSAAMEKDEIVFPARHVVRPQDLGLLAECGAAKVNVFRQPTIAILPTGDELVDCSEFPGPGMIRNSNGPMLLSLARSLTDHVVDLGIGKDDREALRAKVRVGLHSDFLILSGGVSAGMLDLVPEILTEEGVQQVFHKIAIKPGKPIWFGSKKDRQRACYVFGLPGNPVSSLVGFNVFVRAALSIWVGGESTQSDRIFKAVLDADHEVRGNRTTYWPVIVEAKGSQNYATPIGWRGSSDMRALGKSNGLGIFPFAQGNRFEKGVEIEVMRLN